MKARSFTSAGKYREFLKAETSTCSALSQIGVFTATDLMWVQALVRGLMKFVVKEFLSARRAVLPGERRPGLTAPGRIVSHSSFPGNDLERIAGGQAHLKLRQNARSGSTSAISRRFVASSSVWRVTAGKEGPKAVRAMPERTLSHPVA
jgi:hypothetical protein